MRRAVAVLTVVTALGAGIPAARADWCYEGIGCVLTQRLDRDALGALGCQTLWDVRNRIYQLSGYCFRTPAAIAAFGNEGCRYSDIAAVPLSDIARANVAAVAAVERRKSCR